jgi:multidrug resistance efflux pump
MKFRAIIFVALALILVSAAFAQQKTEASKVPQGDFRARLEASEAQIQTSISSLEAQLSSAESADADALQRQIIDLKHQGEIDRLHILLEWAGSTGDAARVAEIQNALNQLQNPPQMQATPQQTKNPQDYPGSDPKNAPLSK